LYIYDGNSDANAYCYNCFCKWWWRACGAHGNADCFSDVSAYTNAN
jgi:hypothetical protein